MRGISGKAISRKKRTHDMSVGCAILFFGAFFALGSVIFVAVFVLPMWQLARSGGWEEVQCEVLESRVAEHRDSDGTTYSPDVTFQYTYRGQQYTSSRARFSNVSSGRRSGAQQFVNRYPKGKQTVCYVDPDDPGNAVLDRNFSSDMLFGLFPLIFVTIGVVGIAWNVRAALKRRASAKQANQRDVFPEAAYASPDPRFGSAHYASVSPDVVTGSDDDDFDDDDDEDDDDDFDEKDFDEDEEGFVPSRGSDGPVTLRPESNPLTAFFVVLAICLFWNGIVSVFLWQAYQSFMNGGGIQWFMLLFLTPFVLIGVVLLFGVIHTFLSIFNPIPQLHLSTGNFSLGDELEVSWEFRGSTRALRRLTIHLKGTEKATYRRGTSTHTDTHDFAKFVVFETADPGEMARGKTILRIPANTMHSFETAHNEIHWALALRGTIAFWPDVNVAFPIVVHPAPLNS